MQTLNCVLCDTVVEDTNHLFFFYCFAAVKIWNNIANWLGITFVHHPITRLHLIGFEFMGYDKKENKILKIIWIAIVCTIWNLKNNIFF